MYSNVIPPSCLTNAPAALAEPPGEDIRNEVKVFERAPSLEGFDWARGGLMLTSRDKVVDYHYIVSGDDGISLDVEGVLHSIESM